VSDFADDAKVLYRNDGDASFTDVSDRAGIGKMTIPFLSWGDAFIDYDNDGWKDIFIVNGHVYPQADKSDWGSTYAQRPLLFRNTKDGKFEYVPAVKGTGLAVLISARGAAFGDLFQRRQDRRGDQPYRRASGPAAQCEPGPSSLGGAEVNRGSEKLARCSRRHGVPESEWDAPARERVEFGELHFLE